MTLPDLALAAFVLTTPLLAIYLFGVVERNYDSVVERMSAWWADYRIRRAMRLLRSRGML